MHDPATSEERLLLELNVLKQRLAELEGADEALRASEERYRVLVDAIDDGIHVNDADGRYIAVNAEMARRQGITKEELVGKTPFDIYSPQQAQAVMDQYRFVLTTGEAMDAETEFPGTPAPYRLVRRVPMRNEAGAIVGVVTVSRNISSRKEAEEALRKERDFTSAVIDTVANLVIVLDLDGRIVRINRACERITGYTFEQVKGKAIWEVFLPPAEIEAVKLAFGGVVGGLGLNSYESHWLTRDGHERLIAWTNTVLLNQAGQVEFVIAAGSDITKQRQIEEALQENNERLTRWVRELEQRNVESGLLNEMGDLLQTCRTLDEAYSVLTHSAQKLFPDMSGNIFMINASRNLVDVVASWGESPAGELVFAPDDCWALRRGRVHVVGDLTSGLICRHLDQPLPSSYLCVPMMAQGETLGVLHLRVDEVRSDDGMTTQELMASAKQQLAVTVAEHIAMALANLKLQKTLRDQAIHDLLTGLFNRRYMEEMLDRELLRAARRHSPVGVIIMDIDHFKQFNDLFGHEAGDTLLSALGSYLRTQVRGEDIVCRFGGEEITLVLPDASLHDTRQRAEKLREGVKSLRVEWRRQPLGPVTVSMGVAAFPTHGDSRESIVHAADLALYRAKAEGRDCVVTAPA